MATKYTQSSSVQLDPLKTRKLTLNIKDAQTYVNDTISGCTVQKLVWKTVPHWSIRTVHPKVQNVMYVTRSGGEVGWQRGRIPLPMFLARTRASPHRGPDWAKRRAPPPRLWQKAAIEISTRMLNTAKLWNVSHPTALWNLSLRPTLFKISPRYSMSTSVRPDTSASPKHAFELVILLL